jgi:hypothetical protein
MPLPICAPLFDELRRELDRAIADLETMKKERDEAMAIIRRLLKEAPEPSREGPEETWAEVDDLEKRAAATDGRLEKRRAETARVKERAERAQKAPASVLLIRRAEPSRKHVKLP